ncbi:uncharacterized protein METZ01_LOCUS208888, partial [marine metagenome]
VNHRNPFASAHSAWDLFVPSFLFFALGIGADGFAKTKTNSVLGISAFLIHIYLLNSA